MEGSDRRREQRCKIHKEPTECVFRREALDSKSVLLKNHGGGKFGRGLNEEEAGDRAKIDRLSAG